MIKLRVLILLCLWSICCTSVQATTEKPLRIAAFYSSTCNNCHKAKKALAEAARIYGDKVVIENHDVADEEQFVLMFDYEEHYNGQEQAPPKVYIGTQCLEGYPEIGEKLIKVIDTELARGSVTFDPQEIANKIESTAPGTKTPTASERLAVKVESFSAGAVALAGLIDGVNPCAFTTIVFLISMLTHLGKSHRELAIVGIGFTLAVFVTYMLLGLGALRILQTIKNRSVDSDLASYIAAAVGIAALIFGLWSLIDYIRYKRTGQSASMTLGLPHSLRIRINKVIRQGLSAKSLAAGSIVVGILVALLESACTGQIYLPTIVLVLQNNKLQSNALAYLLLYNLMFIAPLAIVLLIAYKGTTSQTLAKLVNKNLALAKLTLSVLFISLGIMVLITL